MTENKNYTDDLEVVNTEDSQTDYTENYEDITTEAVQDEYLDEVENVQPAKKSSKNYQIIDFVLITDSKCRLC